MIILNSLFYLKFGKKLYQKKHFPLHDDINLMENILYEENNIFNNLFKLYEKYNLSLLDLRLPNLGYTNNQLKLIDYGFTINDY
jgi:hypothetical protein